MDTFTRSYQVHESTLAVIAPRINKLASIADKLGLPPIKMEVTGEEFRETAKHGQVDKFVTLELSGALPVLNGWRFLGKLEHTAEGNILKGFGAGEIEERFADCKPNCDHCNTFRQRNGTFVVSNTDTGEQKQVGSTCVEDFTGHSDPHLLLSFYDGIGALGASGEPIYEDIDEIAESEPGLRRSSWLTVEDTLATACAVIRHDGRFVSASKAEKGEASTADTVHALMMKAGGAPPNIVEQADKAKGALVLEWMRNVESNGQPYLHNLKVLGKAVAFDANKHINFVVSAPAAYERAVAARLAEEQRLNPNTNRHILEQGEKFKGRKVVFEKAAQFPTRFGVSANLTFTDVETGATFLWKTSSSCPMKKGHEYLINGTVKGHSYYQERAQTELVRVAAPDLDCLETLTASFRHYELGDTEKQLKAILKKLSDPNVVNSQNITPLIAVGFYAESDKQEQWLPVINSLLAAGADPLQETGYDQTLRTPLDIALMYGGGSPMLVDAYLTHLASKGVEPRTVRTVLVNPDADSLVWHAYDRSAGELEAMLTVIDKHDLTLHPALVEKLESAGIREDDGFELNSARAAPRIG